MRKRTLAAASLSLVLGAASCGSGEDSGQEVTTTSTTTPPVPSEHCQSVAAYQDAVENIDTSSVEVLMDDLRDGAVTARAMADAAPAEVRDAASAIAAVAERLTSGLASAAPATVEEAFAASDALVTELTAEYGDLNAETAQMQAHATETCGITFE